MGWAGLPSFPAIGDAPSLPPAALGSLGGCCCCCVMPKKLGVMVPNCRGTPPLAPPPLPPLPSWPLRPPCWLGFPPFACWCPVGFRPGGPLATRAWSIEGFWFAPPAPAPAPSPPTGAFEELGLEPQVLPPLPPLPRPLPLSPPGTPPTPPSWEAPCPPHLFPPRPPPPLLAASRSPPLPLAMPEQTNVRYRLTAYGSGRPRLS